MRRVLMTVLAVGLTGCGQQAVPAPTAGTGGSDPSPGSPDRPARPAGWVAFRHPSGAYSIYTPGEPVPAEPGESFTLTQPVPAGRAVRSKHQTHSRGPNCELEVAVFSPELVPDVEAAWRGKPHPTGAIKPTSTPVTWAGHPAVERTGEFKTPDGNRRTDVQRWMFVGNRLYVATLSGLNGSLTAAERAAFFDSFTPGT
jgi:hypothetical protein